ncbi:MAG TPA: FtsX-like permease family protein [Acidimicrobiales bacterium]|nr:FtsX-like permease family protein [Acidimicrobiales bacterium]
MSITSILALTVALALVMLMSMKAVEGRIDDVKGDIGTTITISPAGARGFAGGGDPLTVEQVAAIEATAHVVAVAQTLSDQVSTEGTEAAGPQGSADDTTNATTNLVSAIDAGALGNRFGGGNNTQGTRSGQAAQLPANFSLPITLTGTTDPTSTQVSGVNTFTITAGAAVDGFGTDKSAMVGTSLAAKNNLSVGSSFTAYGQTIDVVGIYDTGNTFTNGGIIMSLATVQTLSGQTGAVTTALAKVDSISNVASTTSALQSMLGSAADVVSDATNSEATISSLENVKTISSYSLIGALVGGAVIIFLSMLMIVRERRREIGVLKAIGSSNSRISAQFVIEALTLTVMAAVVGVIAGVILSNPVLDVLVKNSSDSTAATVAPGGGPRAIFGGPAAIAQGNAPTGGNAPPGGFAPANGGGFAPGGISRGVTNFGGALGNVRASVGISIVLYGMLAAVFIAIAGSAVPSYFIARIRPAEVMRSE